MKKIYVMAVIFLTLSACASNRAKYSKIKVEDHLVKEITQDHVKLFTYSIIMSFSGRREIRGGGGFGTGMGQGGMSGGMGGGGMGMPGRRTRDPEAMKQRMEERALQRLSEKIKESSYCRKGYQIIDKDIARGNATIQGQCNEPANEADIKKFKTDKPAG